MLKAKDDMQLTPVEHKGNRMEKRFLLYEASVL